MSANDLVIVGSGPAGLSAAVEAAKYGVKVTVIDENSRPGGQLFKQIHKFFGSEEHHAGKRGIDIAYELLQQCEQLGVKVHLNSVVWGIFPDAPDGNKVLGIKNNNNYSEKLSAKKVIIAAGAKENNLAFPGWTLPGVMGAGAAQTLTNLHRILPGKKVLMVGSGNVGLIVCYQLLQAGAEIAALIEALPEISGWDVHARKIRRAGIPVYTESTVKEVYGNGKVETAVISKLGPDSRIIPEMEIRLNIDTVCLAVGLTPMAEICWSAGCRFAYIPELGGNVPLHNDRMETSVDGLYVAGDVSGVEEASTAMEEGKIAGISVAASLGYLAENIAAEMIKKIYASLDILRGGELGLARKTARQEVLLRWHEPEADPALKRPHYLPIKKNAACSTLDYIKYKKRIACIECTEEIPCNPCEAVCPHGAIKVGKDITSLPELDIDKCTGCGVCLPACPGLAIFLVDYSYSDHEALVTIPYEFLPLPEVGEKVSALDRNGKEVGTARIISVKSSINFNKTAVVTFAVEKDKCTQARSIKLARAN
jgi:thioredoxin reductase/Fe-S-cluster-containing hydrogenase component 2